MKNLRKDNKGFSLVELIVVVLIMAIIAVALAPQVMKWVNNSRITADQNAAGNLKSAVQAGYADYLAKGGTKQAWGETTINGTYTAGDSDKIGKAIESALGGETYKSKYDDAGFKVSLSAEGAVTINYGAKNATLD